MISEYFIRERLDKLYTNLADLENEAREFEADGWLNDPEYIRLCEEYDFIMEKIDLLHWVLGDE